MQHARAAVGVMLTVRYITLMPDVKFAMDGCQFLKLLPISRLFGHIGPH